MVCLKDVFLGIVDHEHAKMIRPAKGDAKKKAHTFKSDTLESALIAKGVIPADLGAGVSIYIDMKSIKENITIKNVSVYSLFVLSAGKPLQEEVKVEAKDQTVENPAPQVNTQSVAADTPKTTTEVTDNLQSEKANESAEANDENWG